MSGQRPCYINSIPSEIVSEVLLSVIDSFGDNTRLKWGFPLLVRRVSKRFYHITNDTRSIWRYLYIRCPLHPYLQTHISRSAPLSLVVDAMYINNTIEHWRKMIDLILPTFPRLASLIFHSSSNIDPICELLCHQMPVLKLLDVQGTIDHLTELEFSLSRTPALRCLRSVDCFPFHRDMYLPETLEELRIGSEWDDVYPSESLWNMLPKGLRVLRVDDIMVGGFDAPSDEIIQLPCLTELHFIEYRADDQFSILPFLDAPCLQTLTTESTGEDLLQAPDCTAWFTRFPMLTHLEWKPWYNPPVLARTFEQCSALKSLSIKPKWRSSGVEALMLDFAEALARDPSLLPLLEDLLTLGGSLPSLRQLVYARPRLRRIEVHRSDLRPDLTSECMPADIEFRINHDPVFYPL